MLLFKLVILSSVESDVSASFKSFFKLSSSFCKASSSFLLVFNSSSIALDVRSFSYCFTLSSASSVSLFAAVTAALSSGMLPLSSPLSSAFSLSRLSISSSSCEISYAFADTSSAFFCIAFLALSTFFLSSAYSAFFLMFSFFASSISLSAFCKSLFAYFISSEFTA